MAAHSHNREPREVPSHPRTGLMHATEREREKTIFSAIVCVISTTRCLSPTSTGSGARVRGSVKSRISGWLGDFSWSICWFGLLGLAARHGHVMGMAGTWARGDNAEVPAALWMCEELAERGKM